MLTTQQSQRVIAPLPAAKRRDLGALSALDNNKLLAHFLPHLLQGDLSSFESFTATCRRARMVGLVFVQAHLHKAYLQLATPELARPEGLPATRRRRNIEKIHQALTEFHRRTAPNTFALLATHNFGRGDFAGAERAANHALSLRPNCLLAILAKAEVCIRAPERAREATDLLDFACAVAPKSLAPLLRLATFKLDSSTPAEAVLPLYSALDSRPDSAALHRTLAVALDKLGQYVAAQEHARTADELERAQQRGDGGARAAQERARHAQMSAVARRLIGLA